ncbi:MAG: T9SS type A sorting domain-containing protein [Bacteroidetes bacterium]|nr:T9SS type A sorting domain-containing protein [Bacteroidota bacterium]
MDKNNDYLLRVSPNPAHEFACIYTNNKSEKKISIFNAEGTLIFEKNFFEQIIIIETQSLSAGAYVVNVSEGVNKYVTKMIIAR